MSLSEVIYSQSSLQDFEECPRRFQLRYLERRVWPAVQAEPLVEHERHLERGARFHRLVERHQLGLPEALLTASIDDAQVLSWWRAYLDFEAAHVTAGQRYPEFVLSADLSGARFVAKFDLLLVQSEECVTIFDWKTYPRSPGRDWLANRAQTRVYPVVLLASGRFPWLKPSMVKLVYWIAGAADIPVEFVYDESSFERDQRILVNSIEQMERLADEQQWPLTLDERACRYCAYRSLCGRGIAAAELGASVEDEPFDVGVVDVQDVVVGFDLVDDVGF